MFPQGLERDLGVRDGTACGGAEGIGDLRSGEPVAGDLEGLAEVAAGVGEGQGGEGADVVDGDELHDAASTTFVPWVSSFGLADWTLKTP